MLVPVLLVTLGSNAGSSVGKAVFQDDFSSRAGGWDDTGGANRNGGRYVNGAYRLYTHWAPDHYSDDAFPAKAASVFPSAPRDVTVDVAARRLLGGDQDAGYGIACRAAPGGSSYYLLSIWKDHVEIAKVTPTGQGYEQKTTADLSAAVSQNGVNRMQAVCTTDRTGAAHLVLSVNGQEFAAYTDTESPLSTGTVGLVVATGGAGVKAIEAEFDDFVVTPA